MKMEKKTKWLLRRLVLLPIVIFVLHIISLLSVIRKFYKFIRILIRPKTRPLVLRTPDECFYDLEHLGYNFKPNYVELPIGGGKTLPRLHYVDEGK